MNPLIYHNPRCSNSRNALAMMRASGEEPTVVEYLKHPLDRAQLVDLVARVGVDLRELMRTKEAVYQELNLDDASLSKDALIDAIVAHPVLLNRPIVVTPKGARLCRPPETVLALLDKPVSSFTKENGQVVTPDGDAL